MNSHKHDRLTFDRRMEMVRELTVDGLSTSEVASRFAVTLATVRKWLGRYLAGGDSALVDASSRPRTSPRAIDPKSGSYPVAGSWAGGLNGLRTGAILSLT